MQQLVGINAIKVAPTDHPAFYLSSWLRLMAWGGEGKPFAKFVA
jgi:hypothetical protein